MKLEKYNHKVNSGFNLLVFNVGISKPEVLISLRLSLERLGGKLLEEKPKGFEKESEVWQFPDFVTSKTIEELIKNTCFECGGLMKDSMAYNNEDLYSKKDERGRITVYKNAGTALLFRVRKCLSCGHSHT